MELNTNENINGGEATTDNKKGWIDYAILGVIVGVVIVFLLFSLKLLSGKDEDIKENTEIEVTEDLINPSELELTALLEYLDGLDSAVLSNADALDGLGDYKSVVSRKMTMLKDSTQNMIDLINNYLVSGESMSPETRKTLEQMLKELRSFYNTLDSKDGIIGKLLEEYSSASKERREEITKEIADIFKEITRDSEKIKDSYNEVLKLLETVSINDNPKLKEMLEALKLQMERFTDKLLPSIDNLINPDDFNLTVSLEEGFTDLSEVMNLLHKAIESNKSDVTNILNKMQDSDSKDRETITREFNTVIENIDSLKSDFKSANDKVTKLITELDKDMDTNHKELKDILEKLQLSLDKLLEENFKAIDESLNKLSTDIEESFTKMNKLMNENFTSIGDSLNSSFTDMGEVMNNSFLNINNGINYRFDTIDNSLTTTTESLTQAITNTDTGVKEYLEQMSISLGQKLDSVFQFVSDGKKLLASALLTKGVDCAGDATFREIYEAILRINQTLVVGVEQLPGEIEYDFHYHTDGHGEIVHATEVGASKGGGCFTNPILHSHDGSPSIGGGCYGTAVIHSHTNACITAHKHTSACVYSYTGKAHTCVLNNPGNGGGYGGSCSCGCYYADHSGVANCGNPNCPQCFCPTTTITDYRKCTHELNDYGCGFTEGQIERYEPNCGIEAGATVGYSTACGLADGQIIGAHIIYEKGYTTGFNGNLNNAKVSTASAGPLMSANIHQVNKSEDNTYLVNNEEENTHQMHTKDENIHQVNIPEENMQDMNNDNTDKTVIEENGKNLDEENKDETENKTDEDTDESSTPTDEGVPATKG